MAYKDIEKRRENDRRYYERHKEKIKARKREAVKLWYHTHKDKRKEYLEKNKDRIRAYRVNYNKQYYQNHKEEHNAYNRLWASKNKEKVKEKNRLYRLNNLYKVREYGRNYYQKQKLKAFQAIKNTAKEILITSNQNFIKNNQSQIVVKPKRVWKNKIFERIYELLGTPAGVERFNELLKRQSSYKGSKSKEEYQREYQKKYKEQHRKNSQKYYEKNRKKILAKQKVYREKKKRGVIIDG